MRAAPLAFVVFVSCLGPTALDVSVYTEAPCDSQVAVVVATSLEDLATKLSAGKVDTRKTGCDTPGGTLEYVGDVVLTPKGDKNESAAFAVMTRLDGLPPDDCGNPSLSPSDVAECIIARRSFGFIPHSTYGVRVDLLKICAGVPCSQDKTCNNGACVPAQIANGLIGLWTLGESAPQSVNGADFADTSGFTDDGVAKSQVSFGGSGKVGPAASFTNGSFVSIGSKSVLMPQTAVTTAAWINATKATAVHYPQIFTAGDDTGLSGYNLYLYNCQDVCGPANFTHGAASFILKEGNDNWGTCWVLGTTDLRDGTWHHVAGTYDGSTISIYVDGVLQSSAPCSNQPIKYVTDGSTPTVDIATKAEGESDSGFEGAIQQVVVWNRGLDADEIAKLYNGGAGVVFP